MALVTDESSNDNVLNDGDQNISKDMYFESYSDIKVHNLMLSDEQRVNAYREAIFYGAEQNYWENKIVLDVGAGTGILSLFCAKSGAKKVYAVEASHDVASLMKKIVEENNYQDVIQVLKGRVEDVSLPCKVDAIISEWMGFYLLHEGMLQSVLFARDKYLKKDGVMLPECCHLFVAPCSLPSYFELWDNIAGINMQSFALALRQSCQKNPEIIAVDSSLILVKDEDAKTPAYRIDLYTVTANELKEINIQFLLVSKRSGKYQGLCIWFDVLFPTFHGPRHLVLSTSPYSQITHWKQTVIVFPECIDVEENEPIAGSITFKNDSINNRKYNIEFLALDSDDVEHPETCTCYNLRCRIVSACVENYNSQSENCSSQPETGFIGFESEGCNSFENSEQ